MMNCTSHSPGRPAVRRSIGAIAAVLALAGGVMLGACGDTGPERPETVEAFNLAVPGDSLGRRLHVFTWPDYMDPALIRQFEEVYGLRVVVDYFDTNEALIAKLRAGGTGQYDIIVASDYAVEILARDGLLQELRKERLPNLANLASRFVGLPFDPGNIWSAVYQWGVTGLGIRADRVGGVDGLDTWAVVFDSAAAVGPFTMLDDARETIGAALIYLGHPVNTIDSTHLASAERLLLAQRPRLLAYASFATGSDLLTSADAVVAHNFSGTVNVAHEEMPEIQFVVPREGSIIWTDNMAVPVGAPNRYAAEIFINFVLDARIGADLSNFTRFASPNEAAMPFIDPALLTDPAIYPPPAMLDRLQFIQDIGEARRHYDRIWTRLRAGG